MGFRSRKKIAGKTPAELDAMQAAGEIVGKALQAVKAAAAPGVSTKELDEIAETVIRDAGAYPTFLGYQGFPASICASVNEVIVHGIPAAEVVLKDGDLVSIDCGATLDGWVGDSAWSFGVGTLAADVEKLNQATEMVMNAGIKAMIPGARLTDISHALEQATYAAEDKFGLTFGIVDGYGGHGIGREMHMDPFLANEGRPGRGPVIQEGTTLCIEPMLTLGTFENTVLADGWTVVTTDGSWSAHWEHTVAATAKGPRILTPRY
ncbi:type I methionyl aminopeptidase [Corynebacterium caspium]|uniref:type I methionyl aminopeptidase n=1 Tax=Corynebacterium caspium TaxID=234828 RepID=UPI00037D474F|nr:type I methionyl aminopeptidase [Corynebacterium caspium]WKD59822.1 Methionine aminopeptidase 1 [Corynebacterium caspium DSM 44850]